MVNRLVNIDILRGIAALGVTYFHLAGNSGLSNQMAESGYYGWLGIVVFFVISGFILPYSMQKVDYIISDFWMFIAKRLLRLYPIYLLAVLLNLTLSLITGREDFKIEQFFAQLFFLNDLVSLPNMSPVFWTLNIELQFYLFLGLLFPLIRTQKSIFFVLLIVLSLLSFKAPTTTIFYWFPYFGLGLLIYKKVFKQISDLSYYICIAFILIYIYFTHDLGQSIASVFAICFIQLVRIKKESYFSGLFVGLGLISYSLYLTHWEIGRSVVSFSRRIPYISELEIFKVLFGLACAIVFSFIVYKLVELPFLKLGAKLKYKRKPAFLN